MSVRIVNGQLTVLDDARLVIAAPGNIIPLLPTAYDLTITNLDLDYPDPPGDHAYIHQWISTYDPFDEDYSHSNSCAVGFTRLPQEWSQTQVLGTAPVGATFVVVRARLQRTIAPSHTWNTQSLIARPPDNEEVPFAGSLLLESVTGISRLLHVTLDPLTRQVVLEREQTVGAAAGGFGSWGNPSPLLSQNSSGGSLLFGSAAGHFVYSATGSDYVKSSGPVTSSFQFITPTNYLGRHQRSGALPGSLSDPTNYAVRYRLNATVMFGKDT